VDFAGTIVRPYSPRDVHGALQSAPCPSGRQSHHQPWLRLPP
jgi:hypothetical protein